MLVVELFHYKHFLINLPLEKGFHKCIRYYTKSKFCIIEGSEKGLKLTKQTHVKQNPHTSVYFQFN